MEEEDAEYGLVMPFLPVTSKGGPYDDQAFVAGYQMGQLDRDLAAGNAETRMIYAPLADQADLIAMERGFTTAITPTDDGEWAQLELHRARR